MSRLLLPRGTVLATLLATLALAVVAAGCATLGRVLGIEPPRFEVASERESVISLDPSSILSGRPTAHVRLWARVTNPNDVGLTLSTLAGDIFLEGNEMAAVDLPLGLPLPAARDTVIPLDIRFGLPALSALGRLGEALLSRRAVSYRLDGTVGIDAGALGEPTFGPRTWLSGELEVRTGLDQKP